MSMQSGINTVQFKSQGYQLAGLLFTPNDFDATKQYPTVVFTGPFNQVKEQTGTVYGKKLAQQGYVVLSFDHVGYGDSEGDVRNNENASWKMEGVRDAVSYLGTLPFVNKDKLYGLGVCAGGGYMAIVAVTDKRLKAIATVSGMMDNTASYFGVMSKEQLMPIFKMANDARQRQYETGTVEYYDVLGVESLDVDSLDKSSAQYEGYDFYMTERAGKQTYPNYSHKSVMTVMEDAPLTSATALAPYLYTPYLGIYGEKAMADTAPLTVNFYNQASEPKELYEVSGASHVSLYDIDKDVDRAVAKMDAFFKKHGQ
ncbi:alpha/beta hydrolase [Candidatus Albibeggiatoa sp. nov. NOAA]|uniref:alpha/beta hydrolase n=1 Tax=Candidatus Albibeggiatoa sp. nov. NOAA TaxID=3162724 RepID=UPI0032FF33A9|nr:alpha/beta hydrolase [Thiotrichaceae bacterium]